MRYVAGFADSGKFKGEWVVVDTHNGSLAIEFGYATKRDAEFAANWLSTL